MFKGQKEFFFFYKKVQLQCLLNDLLDSSAENCSSLAQKEEFLVRN